MGMLEGKVADVTGGGRGIGGFGVPLRAALRVRYAGSRIDRASLPDPMLMALAATVSLG